MKLIVGLGNKGSEYSKTRHNVGFMVVDELAKQQNISNFKEKMGGLYADTIINDEKVIILKPNRYINLSGEVIKTFVDYFNINLKDIIIIHDDMDTPIGKFKIKQKGSSAGHNGLKNIELNLGTNEYNRVKIGISRDNEMNVINYVLGKFNSDEYDIITHVVNEATKAVLDFINSDILTIMNKYNNQEKYRR